MLPSREEVIEAARERWPAAIKIHVSQHVWQWIAWNKDAPDDYCEVRIGTLGEGCVLYADSLPELLQLIKNPQD